MLLLSRVVRTATRAVVVILVVAILLIVLGANTSNDIVDWFRDAGSWLAGPFKDLLAIHNHKGEVAANWGIAAVVYGFVGRFIARLLGRAAAGGWSGRRATTTF